MLESCHWITSTEASFLRRNIDVRIEPMPYRPEDFTDSDPLAVEVMATGEEIKI